LRIGSDDTKIGRLADIAVTHPGRYDDDISGFSLYNWASGATKTGFNPAAVYTERFMGG
jgi:hypothetical protein